MRIFEKPLLDVSEKQARLALATLIAASTLLFSYLACLKYANFNWETPDTAFYSYAFNQTLKGRFFPLFVREGSLLGSHVNFLVFTWLPIFWLAPFTYSLLFFQSLMISLAAWPTYLLARDKTHNRLTALIAAAGILLFPPIVGQHVNQIHDDQFGLALLLFALYYFETGNFKRFIIFLALSLLAKETLALSAASFGLYALVRRRQPRWVLLPIGASLAYLILALKVVMPMGGDWISTTLYAKTAYFSEYGNSPLEVLEFIAANPTRVISTMFGPDRIWYLVRLLQPVVLALPFGNWAWILAGPALGVNLLGTNHLLRNATWHYSLIPGGLLWGSFVLALPFWSRKLAAWFGGRDYTRGLCTVALLLCLSNYSLWFVPAEYQPAPVHEARREALRIVPENATVLCPDNMLAHFARHPSMNSLYQLHYYGRDINQLFDYEYAVFDANFWVGTPGGLAQAKLLEMVSQHPDYRLVFSRDNVFVFQRVGTPPRVLKW